MADGKTKRVELPRTHWNFVLMLLKMLQEKQPNPLLAQIVQSIAEQSGEKGE